MANTIIPRGRFFLAAGFIFGLLTACQAYSPTSTPPFPPPTDAPTATQAETPTSTPTPAILLRLRGEDLPTLEIVEPGESPTNRLRPQIGNARQTLDTEHFRIHYALESINHPPMADENNDGHPDYVEEVARAVEYVWESEIDYFGWPAPPPDVDLGGDDRYDVYLQDLESDDLLGYASEDDEAENVDNPNSPMIERFAKSSYFVIENDYFPIESMYSTVAHEFMHSIQFGIDARETQGWLWEATATWMEEEVFDSVNDAVYWVTSVFKSPDSCQLTEGGIDRVEDYGHWYGEWIFLRYLSENYGHAAVRSAWELAADTDGYKIWDAVLARSGTSLEQFFQEYSIALLLRDFDEGDTYPAVRLEGTAYENQPFTPTDGVNQLGSDYIQISSSGMIIVTVESDSLTGVVVGISHDQAAVFPLTRNQMTMDSDAYQHLYLIVLNTYRAAGINNCHITDYTVSITSGGGPQEPAQLLPADHFSVPYVEGLLDYNDYFRQ